MPPVNAPSPTKRARIINPPPERDIDVYLGKVIRRDGNIIIVNMGIMDMVMFNPRILSAKKPFETEEGCLSLTGVRKTTRYEEIEVEFRDMDWKLQRRAFTGWTAQIIQHEVDHCNGVII